MSPAPPDDIAVRVDGVSEDLPPAAPAGPHAQGAGRCTRSGARSYDELQRAAATCRSSVAHGRVLRHRRAQRQRQEHAAEVPGRHLPRRRAATIGVRGRLSPFIELGVGFNPDLTARDNVIINAIMLGLTPTQARERFDEIIDVRRARGVPRPQAQELLVGHAGAPRVLGDGPGRRRGPAHRRGARGRRRRLPAEVLRRASTGSSDEGRTILFVTHDMGAVQRFCDRAMLLERGDDRRDRRPARVARALQRAQLRPQRRAHRGGPGRGRRRRRGGRDDRRMLAADRRGRAHRDARAGDLRRDR